MQRKNTHIISYLELVTKEQEHIQKGMNFRRGNKRPVFLMSVKKNSPYQDEWDEEKQLLSYEGHDVYGTGIDKKKLDQPLYTNAGTLTDNGKFFQEVTKYKSGERPIPLEVQVYEKLTPGVWYDKGIFHLIDAKILFRSNRKVIVFYLNPVNDTSVTASSLRQNFDYTHERMIPSSVKVAVWKRDGGKCTTCGKDTGLHYDHILPFSKGGRSDDIRNVQLLCARHNLEKSDKIM
jgi:hypothetical protein